MKNKTIQLFSLLTVPLACGLAVPIHAAPTAQMPAQMPAQNSARAALTMGVKQVVAPGSPATDTQLLPALKAMAQGDVPEAPTSMIIPPWAVSKKTVFSAGEDQIHSFRIPSLVTAEDGSLLLFCEARKKTWVDKSPTDLVMKRSSDKGQTWSNMMVLKSGGANAYMDPCAVVDRVTGRIFVFTCLWPANDHSSKANTAWLMTSDDHGLTWSTPKDVTREIVPEGSFLNGFGPGSGFQMVGNGNFKDRLIVPVRINAAGTGRNRALWSDDHGRSWRIGQPASDGGEFQIAESPIGTLVSNRRGDGKRYRSVSKDGGMTWGAVSEETQLKSVARGCQGSVYGVGDILFHTGPAGGPATKTNDNRANLTLYRSLDGGLHWTSRHLLYDKASGYSCITRLNDGSFAVVFEASDTPGFTRLAKREKWMRLDVLFLPKEIANADYWFSTK